MKLFVKSTAIDWLEKRMEIKTRDGETHILPLDVSITVTMMGYPDREQKTMPAHKLGPYMSQGYRIEQIEYEEG